MTIRLPHSCFIHVPRTGGLWAEASLSRIGMKIQILRGDIDSHLTSKELPEHWQHLTKFSFIRHPLAWVKSRWSHAIDIHTVEDGRHFGIHRVFDECVQPTFEETIRHILKHRPGLITDTFNTMQEDVKYFCCTENLPAQFYKLMRSLESVGEEVWTNEIAVPPFNGTTETYKDRLALPFNLQNEFMHSEIKLFSHWYSVRYPHAVPCREGSVP